VLEADWRQQGRHDDGTKMSIEKKARRVEEALSKETQLEGVERPARKRSRRCTSRLARVIGEAMRQSRANPRW
jgi:hypothetical protein